MQVGQLLTHFPVLHTHKIKVYYEPMLKLDILTESELGQIFGTLDSLIPLHEGEPSACFAHKCQ